MSAAISPADLLARIEAHGRPGVPLVPVVVIDVRSATEFAAGHVPGAINIPFAEIAARATEVPAGADDPVVLYCGHGPRAWIAAAVLRRRGFSRLIYLRGHWTAWRRDELRVELG